MFRVCHGKIFHGPAVSGIDAAATLTEMTSASVISLVLCMFFLILRALSKAGLRLFDTSLPEAKCGRERCGKVGPTSPTKRNQSERVGGVRDTTCIIPHPCGKRAA